MEERPLLCNTVEEPQTLFHGLTDIPKWDDEISGKELAEAKASAARALRKRAATRDMQDEENSSRRQHIWKRRGLS